MTNQDFGKQLTEAIRIVAARQQKKVAEIESEIAELTGYTAHTVQHWRRGNIPKDIKHVELLVQYFVTHGDVDRIWCTAFLTNAEYSKIEEYLEKLFYKESSLKPQKLPSVEIPSASKGASSSSNSQEVPSSAINFYKNFLPPSRIMYNEFPVQMSDVIKTALKDWHKSGDVDPLFSQFYLYRRLQRRSGGNAKLAVNQFLNDSLKVMGTSYEKEAQFLQARYLDNAPMYRIVNLMNLAESSLYALQREAIQRLIEVILSRDQEATAAQKTLMLDRLGGQGYIELMGIDEQLTHLQKLVITAGPPWIIAIEGIGGSGKTTLAHALLHRLIEAGQVDDVGWISAQRERLTLMGELESDACPALTAAQLTEALAKQLIPDTPPERQANALRTRLKELPHVIVIDNLEMVADVESLLPTLQMWANPSKFVLTSRESLLGIPTLYQAKMAELNLSSALQLIRQEAALRGLPVLAASSDVELQPIYEAVGGNPLALRLVVGQTSIYGLRSILQDLRRARSTTADNLYTYIYQKAWAKLDPLDRCALLVMPLASPLGDELEYLAEVGDLDVDEFRMALRHLVALNLVDAHGGLHDRRYSVHGLTRSFLLEQVVKWM